jgi:sulfur-oxidizing protein SoxX
MRTIALFAGLAMLAAAAPGALQAEEIRSAALEMMKRDFKARGAVGMERLDEDPVQALCNRTGSLPTSEQAAPLQAQLAASIVLPADGNLLGDWATGEKVAQSGRGMTWSDKPEAPVGGSCYSTSSASCAATGRTSSVTSMRRSTTPRRTASARRCRASARSAR